MKEIKLDAALRRCRFLANPVNLLKYGTRALVSRASGLVYKVPGPRMILSQIKRALIKNK